MLHNLSFIRSQPYMCSSAACRATVTLPGTGNLGSKLFSNVRNSLSSTIVNGLRPLATHATSRSRLRLYSLELLFQLANWAMTVPSARLVHKDGLPTRYPWSPMAAMPWARDRCSNKPLVEVSTLLCAQCSTQVTARA